MEIPGVPPEEVEEVMKMLEAYERSGRGFGDMPEDLQSILNNVKRAKGQPTGEADTEDITPEPGFVVKTTDDTGRKVFINICHSKQVPAPGGWKSGSMPDKVLKALDDLQRDQPQTDAEALRFPLSCSEVQQDADKQGQPCSTIDCIVHSDVLAAAQQHRPLKAFLIELAMQWAGSKHKMQLNPKFKLPKMTYKGVEVRPQRVRIDTKQLVTDVTADLDEEPTFPLLSSKPAAKTPPPPAAGGGTGTPAVPGSDQRGAVHAGKVSAPTAGKQLSTPAVVVSSKQPVESSVASTGAAAAASHNNNSWQYTVRCEGKPVTHMVVTLQLQQHSSSHTVEEFKVEVCGQQLRVTSTSSATGACLVQLPFATSSKGATAEMQAPGQLLVTLPYLSLQLWVQQLTAEAPHAFTQLPVEHAAYMELD